MFWNRKLSNKSLVAIKVSLVAFTVVALAISLSLLVPVLANTHSSTVTITPTIVPNASSVTFTAHVEWISGPNPIHEFRVYQPLEFSDLVCDIVSGWENPIYGYTIINGIRYYFCQWNAQSDYILNATNPTKDFTFSLNTAKTECCRKLFVETRDDHGFYAFHQPDVCVDTSAPITTKSFIGPWKEENGVEWIDGVTLVNLTAIDPEPHPSNVSKTWYVNIWAEQFVEQFKLDCNPELPCWDPNYCQSLLQYAHDIPGGWWQLYENPFQKEGESCHVLFYYSIDNVGNIEDMKVNCFFVDKTPPEMIKEVGDPKVPLCGVRDPEFYVEVYDEDDMVKDSTYPGPDTTVTKTLDCEKVVWDIELKDLGYDYGHTEFGLVIAFSEDKAEFQVGTGQMFGAGSPPIYQECDGPSMDPPYGCWAGGSGPTHDLPEGIVVTGSSEGSYPDVPGYGGREFHVEIPIEYLNNGDFYWAVSTAANWKEGYGFTRYPEEWVRWSGAGIYAYDGWIDWWVRDDNSLPGTPITLDCIDPEPHPSGDEEVCYKVSLDHNDVTCDYCPEDLEYIEQESHRGDWCCVDAPEEIVFVEDSLHDLEWFCRDAVNKKSEIDLEWFRVDSQPPIITKEMIGTDHLGDCPPTEEGDVCYVKDDEKNGVHILVKDDDTYDCAVDDVTCTYMLWWEASEEECTKAGGIEWSNGWCKLEKEQFSEEARVIFREDSTHKLYIICEDALGNLVEDTEEFLVDSTPPETTKTYGTPYKVEPYCEEWCDVVYDGDYEECIHKYCTWWITSDTEITLTAYDEKVGQEYDNTIYWRNLWFPENDKICQRPPKGVRIIENDLQDYCDPRYYLGEYYETDGWHVYDGPFKKPEESCHVIEYYAVDALGNEEIMKWQCVFVDNTAPKSVKTHDPKPIQKDGFDWVTQDTKIKLDCIDQGDHPVDQETLCFKVSLDDTGLEYLTEKYCEEYYGDPEYLEHMKDGYCCIYVGGENHYEFNFLEDSYHNLEYYCIDHLENDERDWNLIHADPEDITQDGAWIQWYKVDSEPPYIFDKWIEGPQHPEEECPPGLEPSDDICYIDGNSTIFIDVEDGGDYCSVGVEWCHWWYWVDDVRVPSGSGYYTYDHQIGINFPEDTEHVLHIKCKDWLGNIFEEDETFYVDKTPPEIWKEYGDPYYPEVINPDTPYSHWISSDTLIKAGVKDVGPHLSGIKEVKYRYDLVDDKYCEDKEECLKATTDKGWTYVDPEDFEEFEFKIPDDSCHLIEIVATDNVDKESSHKQCVYVDNQAPEPHKEVGEPKAKWTPGKNGEQNSSFYPDETVHCWDGTGDDIDCWKVTKLTPISLDCMDPDPHPVDHEIVCFNVEVDACDKTEDYCDKYGGDYNETGDGFCCLEKIEDFHFMEETEHNLKYYCIDALENKGQKIDEEKFKVEGTKFEIPLFKKWNLISVPFTLLDDNPEVVFNNTIEGYDGNVKDYIDSVWTYDPEKLICGQDWCVWSPGPAPDNLAIEPGWGYWVLVTDKPEGCEEEDTRCWWPDEEPLWLTIGGSLFSPATTPPSRKLVKGWNLIGYYGSSWELYDWMDFSFVCGDAFKFPDRFVYGDKVYCALNSLIDTQEGYPRWSGVWSYINCGDHMTVWLGLNACADRSLQQLLDRMYAGRGYWVELDVEDIYAPATTCIWNSDFECRWTGGGILP